MENTLSSKLNADNLLQKIVADIKACISEMRQEFEDYGQCPLTDDSSALNKFCAKLELLLQFGMRERSGLFGGAKGYWNYMQECLSNNKNLKDGLRFVKARSELKTITGKGRALIRFSLVHHRLADTLQYCLMNTRLSSEWYAVKSLFNQKNLAGDLLAALYDLNDLQFDLDPRDAELDTCWPTFARKGPGVVFNWRPPSRSGSIASLASIPNLEIFPNMSLAMTPNIEEDNAFTTGNMSFDSSEMLREGPTSEEEVERLRQLVDDMTAKYDDASKRIKELEVELNAKESYIREIEIGTSAAFNGERLDVSTGEEESVKQKLKEVNQESSAEDGHVSSQGQSSDDNSHLLSQVQSSAESDHFSSQVHSACEPGANTSSAERGDDAYLSTIASLQQQLMVAVNAREHLSEELLLARVEMERLTVVEARAQLLQQDKSRLIEDVEALNRELGKAREERNDVELRSREDNFFEKAFGDAMKDKASAEASLEELRGSYSVLLGRIETGESLREESEKALDCALAEKQSLGDRVLELEKIGEERELEILQLQKEDVESRKQITELELALSLSRNTVQELEKKLEKASDENLKESEERLRIIDEKEILCETLQKEKSEMSEAFRNAVEWNGERDREVAQLRSKVSELEEQLELSRVALEESNSKAKLLEESVEKEKAELDEVLEARKALESEKEHLVEELRQRSENLEEKTAECRNFSDRWKEVEEKLESEGNLSKALVAEKDKMIADLQEDLDALSGSVQRREKMWENAREGMEGDILEKTGRIQALEQLVADGSTKQRLVELEKKKEELEDSLGAIRLEMEIDQDRGRVQLDDLKQCLGLLEHEKFQMQDQLKERDEQMEKERVSFVESRKKWEEESRTMNEDLKSLKNRVIKLVREKAELWQKTDDLAYEQKLKASYQWMNSADVTNCLICHGLFSVTVRKHHCRKCGRVFCYSCCNNWVLLPHSKIKERICNECHMDMSLLLETTVSSTTDGESDTESDCEHSSSTSDREPAPGDSMEPVSAGSRKPVSANNSEPVPGDSRTPVSANHSEPAQAYSREPALAINREPVLTDSRKPVSVDNTHFRLSDAGEPAEISERQDGEDFSESYCSLFRGDGDAGTNARLRDRSFDEQGVEPAEDDAKSREPAPCLQLNDSPIEERLAKEVLPSGNLENGEEEECLVERGNGEESLGNVENVTSGSSAPWSLSGSAMAAVSWVSSAASATTSLASGLLPKQLKSLPREESPAESTMEGASGIEGEPNSMLIGAEADEIASQKREADGDLFDLISPEEISESRLWPTPDPNVLCGTVIKLCDPEVEGVVTISENELLIKAGKCFAIPVSIEVVGLKLSWQFSTSPKGISFAVLYKESDAMPREDCVSLLPLTRLNSHQQTVTGELRAKKLGVYTLFFDNLASRFTAKKLKYKLQAEMTELTIHDTDDVNSEMSQRTDTSHETPDIVN